MTSASRHPALANHVAPTTHHQSFCSDTLPSKPANRIAGLLTAMQSVAAQMRSPASLHGSISRNGARPALQGPVGSISRASCPVYPHLQLSARPKAGRSAEPAWRQSNAVSPPAAAAASDAHADAGSPENMSFEGGFDQLDEFTHTAAGDNVLSDAASGGRNNGRRVVRGTRAAKALDDEGGSLDWRSEWYPVAFTKDVPEGVPTRITLFDEDYAVVRRPQGPLALIDRCPHRAAALSQGVLTPSGNLQCAYHGWSFDASGACKNIPQLPSGAALPRTTCATAFPAVEHEDILWLHPTPLPPGQSFDAAGFDPLKELHGVLGEEEMQGLVWTGVQFTRDFPIDYSLLLENVMDPDHGMFAHQSTQFDTHAGSPEHPMTVDVGRRGGRVTITSSTPAVGKLGRRDKGGNEGAEAAPPATITFEAPCHVYWTRRTPDGEASSFISFWVVPTGMGRCRFMTRSAGLPKAAKAGGWLLRRWLFAVLLNTFLDQDSFLVASQQRHVLELEAKVLRDRGGEDPGAAPGGGGRVAALRRRAFNYRAPSDALLAALGRWEDAAVPHIPNRAHALMAAYDTGGAALQPLRREEVLDRWAQHTSITPESKTTHDRAVGGRNILAALAALGACAAAAQPSWSLAGAAAVMAVGAAGCQKLAATFHYVYDEEASRKDLARIAPLTAHLQAPLPH